MVLLDTSVWIEFFRASGQFELTARVSLDEVVTCLPVIQEVLQGFDDQGAFQVAREAMFAFPILESPIPSQRYEEAVELYRSARRIGLTVRSGVDCLIAACALQHSVMVLHNDRDFDKLARVSPLKVESI